MITALAFWNAAVRATGIDPGGIYTNTNCHSASYSASCREQSGDQATGTSIGSEVVSDRDSAWLEGGGEIKTKSP